MPMAWERQKGEPAEHFSWFVKYDGLGPGERSLEAVAADVGKSRRQIERVSSARRWVDRAASHDVYEAERWQAKTIARRRAMADRHAQMSVVMQNRIVSRLQSLRPEELSAADVARWLEIATRVERTALGLPEFTTGVSGPDGGAIQAQVTAMDEDAKRAFFARLVAEANARAGVSLPRDGEESEGG